ncbi:hypothetical protein HAX54_033284, partial [Datura stramonium]|nr:hypothetical protein [Datura stramonium]
PPLCEGLGHPNWPLWHGLIVEGYWKFAAWHCIVEVTWTWSRSRHGYGTSVVAQRGHCDMFLGVHICRRGTLAGMAAHFS